MTVKRGHDVDFTLSTSRVCPWERRGQTTGGGWFQRPPLGSPLPLDLNPSGLRQAEFSGWLTTAQCWAVAAADHLTGDILPGVCLRFQ